MQGRTVLSSFLESHHLSKSLLFIDKCSLPKAPFGGEVHQGRSSPARSNKLVYDLCLCILILETSYTGPKVRFDAPIESDWVRAPTPAVLHWVQLQIRWQFLFWRDVAGNAFRVNKTIVNLTFLHYFQKLSRVNLSTYKLCLPVDMHIGSGMNLQKV